MPAFQSREPTCVRSAHVPNPHNRSLFLPILTPRAIVRIIHISSLRSDAMNFFKTKQRTPTDLVRGLRDNILKLESAPPGEPRKKVRSCVLYTEVAFIYMHVSSPPPRPAKRLASTCNRLRVCSMVMEVRFSTIRSKLLYKRCFSQSQYRSFSPSLRRRHTALIYYTYLSSTSRASISRRGKMSCRSSTICSGDKSVLAGQRSNTSPGSAKFCLPPLVVTRTKILRSTLV
jgi:hypothetical protein